MNQAFDSCLSRALPCVATCASTTNMACSWSAATARTSSRTGTTTKSTKTASTPRCRPTHTGGNDMKIKAATAHDFQDVKLAIKDLRSARDLLVAAGAIK